MAWPLQWLAPQGVRCTHVPAVHASVIHESNIIRVVSGWMGEVTAVYRVHLFDKCSMSGATQLVSLHISYQLSYPTPRFSLRPIFHETKREKPRDAGCAIGAITRSVALWAQIFPLSLRAPRILQTIEQLLSLIAATYPTKLAMPCQEELARRPHSALEQ
jgi:hypothetical protein